MRRNPRSGLFVAIALAVASASTSGQQVESVIRSIGGDRPLIRPTQLLLSPSGDRIAVCDPDGNRIYAIDSDGDPVWTIGSAIPVTQPVLIGFESDNTLLYYEASDRLVCRAGESLPDAVYTVISLPDSSFPGLHFDRIVPLERGLKGYLILDRDKSAIFRTTTDWSMDKKLISSGSGKGKLWSPVDVVLDLSNNIVVADESGCPIQVFTSDGKSLFCGAWNLNESQRSWAASAVGMGPGEIIWAADVTNLVWRLFDRAGIQIAQYPFQQPILKPNALVVTPDKRMFIADDNGAVIIMALPE